jgi:ABC-type glycerol-3-phosphate transport system permease component
VANQHSEHKARTWATMLLLVPAIIQFFPILYVISLSFKDKTEVFKYPPSLIPQHFQTANFEAALAAAPLGRFLINSLFIASAITLFQILTAVLAAYALARMEFAGKKIFFALIIATMMVPGEITIIPNYLTVAKLNWIDTYSGLILPFAASGFGVFLLYQFMRGIPKELEEAARLDGASRLRFLFQFAVPLSMPAIAAFSVYAFVNAWNQYLWPLIITQSTEMQTVQIGIGMFRSQNESVSWGVIMAATIILVSPMLILFIGTQKQFVRGMTMGGLK